MKILKIDGMGNIVLVINSNTYNEIPEGFVAFETDEDDLVLINLRYVKNGQLKGRVERPTLNHVWDLTDENWVLDLTMLRTSKARMIDLACKTAIVSGFTSTALGQTYTYPSKTTDQQNLAASYMASFDPENAPDWKTPFWCSDATGEWAFRPHTAAQIREVGRDAKSAVLGYQFHNEQLQAQIAAATTVEELDAITWSN